MEPSYKSREISYFFQILSPLEIYQKLNKIGLDSEEQHERR